MPHKKVSPSEARDLVDQDSYTYLDVRTVAEFTAGRPAGSVNIPVAVSDPMQGMAANEQFTAVVQAHFATDAKLVIGCKAGGRSDHAAQMLEQLGYTNLADQRAGYEGARDANGAISEPGWQPCGLPTDSGEGGPGSYAELIRKTEQD